MKIAQEKMPKEPKKWTNLLTNYDKIWKNLVFFEKFYIIFIEKRMEDKHLDESEKISRVLDNMGKAIDDRVDKVEQKELKDFDIIKEVKITNLKFR